MDRFPKLPDEQIDRLLQGQGPDGEGLEGLAAFAAAARSGLPETPSPAVEARHLAAIVEASQLVGAAAPAIRRPGHERARLGTRRRTMLSTVFSTLAAKIVAASVAAAAATGGLAATGSLPTPAQNAVSSAASHIGVHLPKKGAEASSETNHGRTVSDTARTTGETGRDKGDVVSETAKTNSQEHRKDAEHRPSSGPSGNPAGAGNDSRGKPSGNPTGFGHDGQPSGNPTDNGPGNRPSENPAGYGESPPGRGRSN